MLKVEATNPTFTGMRGQTTASVAVRRSSNRDLNQGTGGQRIIIGEIQFNASEELPDFPNASFAEECGLRGIRVDRLKHVGDVWAQAVSSDRPEWADLPAS